MSAQDMDVSEKVEQPVTVLFTWDVTPGREAAFEEWAHGINTEAARFVGHLGATWLRADGVRSRYYTVLSFSDEPHLGTWMGSWERARWLDRVEGIATMHRHRSTGLETWFSVPGEAVPAPPRWKMALVTLLAVYPLSVLYQEFVVPAAKDLPLPGRAMLFPAMLVPLLTYAVMPALSRLLRRFLYPAERRHPPARPVRRKEQPGPDM